MRKLSAVAIMLAAACGQGGQPSGNPVANRGASAQPSAPVQTATLTGLYQESGNAPSQLCIIEEGGTARFGLVKRSIGVPVCSGAGTVTRRGATLQLVMTGEASCTIEAQLEGRELTVPTLPRSCSYYCSPGGGAGGIALTKIGGTREDAMRARDPVNGQLCA